MIKARKKRTTFRSAMFRSAMFSRITAYITTGVLMLHTLGGCCLHHEHCHPAEADKSSETEHVEHGCGCGHGDRVAVSTPHELGERLPEHSTDCDGFRCVFLSSKPLKKPLRSASWNGAWRSIDSAPLHLSVTAIRPAELPPGPPVFIRLQVLVI